MSKHCTCYICIKQRNYDPVEHYFLGRLALSRIVSREEEEAPLPTKGFLVVYPNPFRGSAMIQYKLPEAAFVDIRVYDVLGRNMAVLAQQRQHAGDHRIVFKTTELVSGTYFLHLRAGTHVQTRSITLLR